MICIVDFKCILLIFFKLDVQKHRMLLNRQKSHNEKDEKKRSLLSPQGGLHSGEGGSNIQFSTQHISNIPHQPFRHHPDGVPVAVSTRNLLMTNQHHLQTSDFTSIENVEESLIFTEEDAEVSNLAFLFTQKSEEMSLSHLHEPVMATTMLSNDNQLFPNQQQMMNFHEPSILHTHSFPLSLTPSSFLDQVLCLCTSYDFLLLCGSISLIYFVCVSYRKKP